MTAAARAGQENDMPADTTQDAVGRVRLVSSQTARRMGEPGLWHWISGRRVTACGIDALGWFGDYGSSAAISCARCARAFARQQQQQQAPANRGDE